MVLLLVVVAVLNSGCGSCGSCVVVLVVVGLCMYANSGGSGISCK